MSHRFASHCCETLFVRSAPVVEEELVTGVVSKSKQAGSDGDDESSMQDLFLHVLDEIQGDLGYMITDKAASHCLRVLLIVFSGKSLDDPQQKSLDNSQHKSLVAGKRKENITISTANDNLAGLKLSERTVPGSFMDALHHIVNHSVASLDTSALWSFATHKVANPTLQLLLELELTLFGKDCAAQHNSILKKLLPDDTITESSDSGKFVNGMLFEPVGSHLLETIIEHAPGKIFKTIYRETIKDRIGSLARNDTASYVVCRVLQRLGPQDLSDAAQSIIAEISILAERSRFNVLRTLAERLVVRQVDSTSFITALKAAYPSDSAALSIDKLLQLPDNLPDVPTSRKTETPLHIVTSPSQNAASVFFQALLRLPGSLSALMFDALSQLEFKFVRCIAHTSPLSPILQTALTADTATIIFRRKMVTRLYGAIAEFSMSPSASHVIDAAEVGTRKALAFVRERVAEELSESEAELRDSPCGRKVWRNWGMDFYQRDRDGWTKDTRQKVGNNGFQSFPGLLGEADASAKEKGKGGFGRVKATAKEGFKAADKTTDSVHQTLHDNLCQPVKDTGKTALDRARERYAQIHKEPPAPLSSRTHGRHTTT